MSQNWNAHWAEENFKPTRLQNWEVPRWHAEWPDRHCIPTKIEAHSNGRFFASIKKTGHPWGDYKGAWELPLKIDRRTAEELSNSTNINQKKFWKAHKAKHELACRKKCKESTIELTKETDKKEEKQNEQIKGVEATPDVKTLKNLSRRNCKIKKICVM